METESNYLKDKGIEAEIERVFLKVNENEDAISLGSMIRMYLDDKTEEENLLEIHKSLRQNLIKKDYMIESYEKKFDTEITGKKPSEEKFIDKTVITKITDHNIGLVEDPIFRDGEFSRTKLTDEDITRKTDVKKDKKRRKSDFTFKDLFWFRKQTADLALFISLNLKDREGAKKLTNYILNSLDENKIKYEEESEKLSREMGQQKLLAINSFGDENLFEKHKKIYGGLIKKITDTEQGLQYEDLGIIPGSVLKFWRNPLGGSKEREPVLAVKGLIYLLPYRNDFLDYVGEYLPKLTPERAEEVRNYGRMYEHAIRRMEKGTKVQLTFVNMPLKKDASDEHIVKTMQELKEAHNYVACAKL